VAVKLDLSPHPLVTAIGASLGRSAAQNSPLETAGTNFDNASRSGTTARPNDSFLKKRGLTEAQAVADALAQDDHTPEFVTFDGLLGGNLEDNPTTQVLWRVLYRDPNLETWLLVLETDILFRDTLRDDRMPFRERDVIWLKRDTAVGEGSGPLQAGEIQARLLRGGFTAAGDVAAAVTGDTAAASETGVYCGGGCTRRSFV
jgi:hypothetical protein